MFSLQIAQRYAIVIAVSPCLRARLWVAPRGRITLCYIAGVPRTHFYVVVLLIYKLQADYHPLNIHVA